ncbi:hypothetical protein ACHAXN_006526 [Cyclotella atomus]
MAAAAADAHLPPVSHPYRSPSISTVLRADVNMVHFHYFEYLPYNEDIDSPLFTSLGYNWKLKIRKLDQHVNMYLVHCPRSKKSKIRGTCYCIITDDDNNRAVDTSFCFSTENDKTAFGNDETIELAPLSDCLVVGSLSVELQMYLHSDDRVTSFYGQCDQIRHKVANVLEDKETADVVFAVKRQSFHAHLNVLKTMAPNLFRTLGLDEHDKSEPVPIGDVAPDIFQTMLEYIYGGDVYISDVRTAKAVIEATDKYGVDTLKPAAEKRYLEMFKFSKGNVTETLLYADAKNCSLIKEAAKTYLMDHVDEVFASDSFETLHQSKDLTKEIILSMSKRRKLE